MKKTILILMVITGLSKILGFIRELLLAFFYGATDLTDIYFISLTIPETIYAFFGIALSTSLIPLYSELKEKHPIEVQNKFINNVLSFIFLSSILLIIFVWIFTPQIVKLFAFGFTGTTFELAVLFTRITIISIYFRGVLYVFKGYLQVNNSFVFAEFTGLFFNLIMIIIIPLSYIYGFIFLPIGFIVGRLIQVMIIYPFTEKEGFKYIFYINKNDQFFGRMIVLAVPGIFGISINQINILIDRTLASQILSGGISALTYAEKINLLVHGVVVITIATVIYSTMSKQAAKQDFEGLKNTLIESINMIIILIIPLSLLFMTQAQTIISVIYGRGAFEQDAIQLTSVALFFYTIGLIGIALREILTRAFFSVQDSRTPTINASISMIINIILNVILSKYLGIGGLALATSISAIIGSILLLYSFINKEVKLNVNNSLIVLFKVISSSLVSIFLSTIILNQLTISNIYMSLLFFT